LRLDPHNQITAIHAANIADEYYEPEFFTTVERSTMQFERAQQIIEEERLSKNADAALRAFRKLIDSGETAEPFMAAMQWGWLKELNREVLASAGRVENAVLMWFLIGGDQWDEAEAIYNNWPERIQNMTLNLEEISIMQASQGKCELALESLQKAHGDTVRVYGEIPPNANRSNSNLALNRVYCLRQLGRAEEAAQILERVRVYVETLRQNTAYGYFLIDAKLQLLDGNRETALDILQAGYDRNELSWTDRYDPVLRTLTNEPRFEALFQRLDDEVDAMRAELGMPAATI